MNSEDEPSMACLLKGGEQSLPCGGSHCTALFVILTSVLD